MADRDADAQLVCCSLARIVLGQTLAQAVYLHAHDRVSALVERFVAAK